MRRDGKKVDLRAIARKAMKHYGFDADFPNKALAQVNSFDGKKPQMERKGVEDLTHLPWSSIDNIDTEDLDQMEYCEEDETGEIHVKVAIADVDAYVPKGCPLDMRAVKNTTSVYTGIEVFPMLPDKLSKNLSSLPVGQERLAMVIEFTVQKSGQVRHGKIYRALVKNTAKLVYEQVGAWLDGTAAAPERLANDPMMQAQIRMQNDAALRLGKYRLEKGALELQTLEARAIVEKGQVLGLVVREENLAQHIIENFMIGANGTMSGMLERMRIPTIQRVVRTPKYWSEIALLAKNYGAELPLEPDARALTLFLAQRKKADPETFPDLSLTIVKLLGSGEYVMFEKGEQIGHFCLAVRSYTHATAPNRRYVDLIIQRLVKAALKNQPPPYGKRELSQLAAWCTEMEHNSKKVERFMVKAEGATLLANRLGDEFEAIITGASDKGVYARMIEPPVEGKVMHWAAGVKVGQKVKVRLVNVNPFKGYIDLEIVGAERGGANMGGRGWKGAGEGGKGAGRGWKGGNRREFGRKGGREKKGWKNKRGERRR